MTFRLSGAALASRKVRVTKFEAQTKDDRIPILYIPSENKTFSEVAPWRMLQWNRINDTLFNVGHLADVKTGVCIVIRLRRVGREHAIMDAIRKLESRGRYKMFTKGEICKTMGIKSTSRIRDMLDFMVGAGQLVGATTAIDGFNHEIAIYGLVRYEQTPLPQDHEIVINGVSCRMYSEVGNYA